MKTKSRGKLILAFSIITFLLGIALVIYHKYRLSYQTSIKYIDLALTSMEKALRYLKTTDTIHTLFFILLGIASVEFIVGILILLFQSTKRKKVNQNINNMNKENITLPSIANKAMIEEVTPSMTKFCMNCGAKVDSEKRFCAQCGYELNK